MTEQANKAVADVQARVISGHGERGKDFIEIWQAPRGPNENIRVAADDYARFGNGLLVTRTPEQEAAVEAAASLGRYLRSDPKLTEPLVCKVSGCREQYWFSGDAFSEHMEFAHNGLVRR